VGVAPFLSWARNRARDDTASTAVDFYYCVHDRSDAVYLDELEALAREAAWLNVRLVCSVEDGHLHADDIANLNGVDIFLCGPQSLTRDLRRQCRQRGVPDRRIHFEDFEFR
jgi:predicted ferric reductase